MKTNRLIIVALILSIGTTFAQKGVEDGSRFGHGEDSVRCGTNLSLYNEYYQQGNFADALPYWRLAFDECPLSTSNLYKHGATMIKKLMAKEKDKAKIEEYYQLLMRVYDQRIKYFGKDKRYPEAYILGLKAVDMLNYKRNSKEVRKEAFELLKTAIAKRGDKTQPAVSITYMTTTVAMFKEGILDAEAVVNNYTTVISIFNKQISTSKDKKKAALEKNKDNIEKLFATSGAATCETIERIYSSKLSEHSTDLEWLKRVNRLLARGDCSESDLFYKCSELLHNIEPSASSAYGLFRMHLKTQNMDKASSYIREAIELEEEDEQKAKYYYQLGLIQLSQKMYPATKASALKAIALKPDYGAPFMLIGKAYAAVASSYGDNEFEHSTVYWAAVDKFAKAKQVDPSIAEDANEAINIYSAHFPGKEEIFFQKDIAVGSAYKIGGWINESTTVRQKK